MDRGADYWVAERELQSKLGLQILLADPYRVFFPDIDDKIIWSFVAFVHIVLITTLLWLKDRSVCGDWVNVESVVWPSVVIVVLTFITLEWVVVVKVVVVWVAVWIVAVWGLGPDLKALPQLLPPLTLTAPPLSSHAPLTSQAVLSSHACLTSHFPLSSHAGH